MQISATSTFTDWTALAGCWGKAGVCRLMEAMRIAGIRDVYWRVFNGGLAMYPSRVAEIQGRQCYENVLANNQYPFANRPLHYLREIDFSVFDAVAEAAATAREFDLRLHLWYSIYEDEHGRATRSRFAAEHPEWWHMDRDGQAYSGTFDWFFEDVRAYKMAIIEELIAMPVEGLLLDFVRHNATASADADGVHRFGYNPEVRAAFQREQGQDPLELPADDERWLAFKREIRTSLVREIRRRMDQASSCRELALMLWPVDYARWACLDVDALTREGAVQRLGGSSLVYSIRPEEARLQYQALKAQANGVPVLPAIMAYAGLRGEHIDGFVEAAEEAGADGVLLNEADAMIKYNFAPTVRAINLGRPNYRRSLKASRAEAGAESIDWDRIPAFTDFLFHYGPEPLEEPAEKTEVRLAYTPDELLVRFRCTDANLAASLAPPAPSHQHQYYLDVLRHRGPSYDRRGVSVLLDPLYAGREFRQFTVMPDGSSCTASFVDEDWTCDWTGEAQTNERGWIGLLRIPFAALGSASPQPGDAWGINLVRGVYARNEIYLWFPVAGQKPCPYELGRLEFSA